MNLKGIATLFGVGVLGGGMLAQQPGMSEANQQMRIWKPQDVKWAARSGGLPAGAQTALLEGDPRQPGPFTMRIKMPDGYRVPPHHHPKRERVTVIVGTLRLGMGDRWDDSKLGDLPTGTYSYSNPGTNHFTEARGETTIQLNAEGPWAIVYVNPADDPRQKSK